MIPNTFSNFRLPRLSSNLDRLSDRTLLFTSMAKVSTGNNANINVEQVQFPALLEKEGPETKRVIIPSEQEVCSEILSTIRQNPEFGFRRVHQAVRARRPDWTIRDARIRTLLQKLRVENSLPVITLPKAVADLEPSDVVTVQLEALFKQPSPHAATPAMPANMVDSDEAEAMATAPAYTARVSLPEGLHAPPRRDALIDASRGYRDRFESLLELERSHQASEVMERLRVWPTLRLQREGLAVTGLVANPGPPPPPPRPHPPPSIKFRHCRGFLSEQ
jgi:hypothetical protein